MMKLLDVRQVIEISAPRSRTQLYREIAAGRFPAPLHICGRALWRSDEVEAANARYVKEAHTVSQTTSNRFKRRAAKAVAGRRKPVNEDR